MTALAKGLVWATAFAFCLVVWIVVIAAIVTAVS